MATTDNPVELTERPYPVGQEPQSYSAHSSSPLLPGPQDPTLATINNSELSTRLLMLAPLMLHLVGSVAITTTLTYALDGRHFHLDRQPRVKLADGTYQSGSLGRNNILQPDMTTILSVALLLLRWVAAIWAAPLCWRVIFLLAGRNGLRHRDIRWVSSYGVLPPATHFRHSRNLLLGLVLLFTLAPYPASPLVTGAVSWVPSSSTLDLLSHPVIHITGPAEPSPELEAGGGVQGPTFSTNLVINLNTAWSQEVEHGIFKRVIPSAAQLSINSTVENVFVPFFVATKIEWFPKAAVEESIYQAIESSEYSTIFQPFIEQLGQSGAIGLIITNYSTLMNPPELPTLPLLVNVAREGLAYNDGCDSSTTFLPNDTTIPSFRLYRLFPGTRLYLNGCFAYANVSYNAGFGTCRACRIASPSTVRNDTELEGMKISGTTKYAVKLMLKHLPTLTPVKGSLPNLADGLNDYVTAALIRSYSALWNTWNDDYTYNFIESPPNSTYRPAFSTLRAEINRPRVYGWLALQLSLTLAGLVFIWLQLGLKHSLVGDTSMVAFDIDSSEVPKPSRLGKDEPREMLKFEPKGDGWKVVVASGRLSPGLELQK
ncbi:hypothetical protein ACGC1H_005308 [Rhizoctonia solani]